MIDLLVIPLLALHLMCVNVAAAGPLVIPWLERRWARDDLLARNTGRFLAWASVLLLIIGSLLGLLVGVAKWTTDYQQVLSQFSSRIYYGVWELAFSLILMVVAAIWLSRARQSTLAGRWIRATIWILATTNLLYHFPFLFALVSDVSAGHITLEGPISSADFRRLIADPSVLARVTHHWLASFAVTGIAIIVFSARSARLGIDDAGRAAVWGGRLALIPTIVQIPVGIWLLLELPQASQQQVMGGDMMATGLFGVSILAALSLLHVLAAIAFGDSERKTLRNAIGLMLLIVVCMTGVLQRM